VCDEDRKSIPQPAVDRQQRKKYDIPRISTGKTNDWGHYEMAKDSLIERLENLPQDRKAMLNRLRRVEGQLRGIQRMIIEEKPCYDVLLQLSAARKAMQRACIEILKNYLQKCVHEAKSPDFENLEKLIEALVEISPARTSTTEVDE
jgi:DNA-binding FrmR family transcriptional regulator